MKHTLRILGSRGIPAAHGGFETFAEHLALYLVQRDWRVVVYCQEDGEGAPVEDDWHGVRRVRIPVAQPGPRGTMLFDGRSIRHAAKTRDLVLTLGYNTASFCIWLRLKGIRNVINMDGIEWKRQKWGLAARTWFYLNERVGCLLGNHLVCDHPAIATHLLTRVRSNKITMIPYGADEIRAASTEPVISLGLEPGRYASVIARPEPENSLLEMVSAFSRKPRGITLAVLGKYDDGNAYHRAVRSAASSEVRFLGTIYDKTILQPLRFHSMFYLHGHQVGGTNPSLVEALGAANAVLAHDNQFNRWVAGEGAAYFTNQETLSTAFDQMLHEPNKLPAMRAASRARFAAEFTWEKILGQYERLLEHHAGQGS